MSVTATQKKTIDNILSVFETGKVASPSAYTTATILKDGAGISYGKHQATDRADSLDAVLFLYMDKGGLYAKEIEAVMGRLTRDETSKVDPSAPPQWAKDVLDLLRKAGTDPVMHAAQDEVFDRDYWNPAVAQCKDMGLTLPLCYAIVYDTCIHSGPGGVMKIRRLFNEVPPARGGDEKKWAQAYIKARRSWLASSSNKLVQKTVYRMDAFQSLIDKGNWELALPLVIRGVTIA